EHPFETGLVQLRRLAEALDDRSHPAADRDVAPQLRPPGLDLVVTLLGEALPILAGIGGQAGRRHGASLGLVGGPQYARGTGRQTSAGRAGAVPGGVGPGPSVRARSADSAASRLPSGHSLN